MTIAVLRVEIKADARGKPYAVIAGRIGSGAWAKILAFGSLASVAAKLSRGQWIYAGGETTDTVARGQRVHEMVAQVLSPISEFLPPTEEELDAEIVGELVGRLLRSKRRPAFIEDVAERYGVRVANAVLDEAVRRGELQ